MYSSLETDVNYFDDFRDISWIDKRLVRVGAKRFAQTGSYITIKLYKKDKERTFKYRKGRTLSTGEFALVNPCRTIIQQSKDWRKEKIVTWLKNLEKSETYLKNFQARKKNAKVKTMITVGLCNIIYSLFYWNCKAMVEAKYEKSFDYFKKFRKKYKFFILNHEPNFSGFASKASFALSSHSNKLGFCSNLIDNEKHYHVLVEFTKKTTDLLNKMTSKAFVVPCLLSTFKYLVLGCSNYELSGPLMEELKIAVKYKSFDNLDVSGVPIRSRLPQICFGSQTKSVQSQTDMTTYVTIKRFTNNLNGENAAEFSWLIDIILSGYGFMKIDSNTLCL